MTTTTTTHEDMETDRQEESVMPPPTVQQPSMRCESSANSSQLLHTPQVKNDFIPKINQEFDSLQKVKEFYNRYAKEGGFGTRSHSSRKSTVDGNVNVIVRKEFCCFKQGLPVKKSTQPNKRRRGMTRENCHARLAVVRKGEKYVVSQFFEGHNHALTSPRRAHLLRSHRKVSAAKKALVEQLSAANVPTCQEMTIFELESGGLENVGCSQQDLYNYKRDKRMMVDGHDANMLYEYFQSEKAKNDGFIFTIEKDDEDRMTHCFWADATARKSYQYFGDVVVFDTTYNTNRYSMIFAPILGVNHHRQTTLFGCAFLCDETAETFEWLFKEWLKAMPAGPPKMIITDQDLAMTKAIASALPNTLHRYCMWHITNKFSERISALAYKEHYEEFKNCIWNSETKEQFEAGWVEVERKSNLSGNDWLQNLHEIRERWVPAYVRHIFSAHMTSSQRAEITHSFFKRYVSKENSLWDFVTRFERALARIRHNELDKDHKDVNERPNLKTMYPMEETMSELYTIEIFYMFQDELFQNTAYKMMATNEDEHRVVYAIQRIKGSGSRVREVVVDKSSNHVSCSCKMFECAGIPCRHILAYFSRMQIEDLPNEYILRRWTKSAKAMRVKDDLGSGMKEICDTSLLERRNRLFQLASTLIDEAMVTEDETEFVEGLLSSGHKKLCDMTKVSQDGEGTAIQVPIICDHGFKEPLQVRAKSCGKRLKGGKEKAAKKVRRCHGCGLTGQSHDKRNCPKLLSTSSQNAKLNDEDDEDDDDDDIDNANDCKCLL
ncbi:protein FAR1-RELATED SEQUENCE 5-like isoform X1 [Rhododendron vialii]|uniref:protein FAR1-RELATED SEQUENCE 5-like isoform X1 n=1 Tax=Rhododendron vialii TaxID=182163 RepID=UPI00265E754B|nr:protein FAR1-RELATED SEQUENCE 5-like isoform X1 [Rhododendron vialii]